MANRPANWTTGTKFINSGRLLAQADDIVVLKGSQNGDTLVFTNASSEVRGLVQAGNGKDDLTWSGGHWAGGFDMGGGNGDHATISGITDTRDFKHALAGSGNEKLLTLSRSTIKGGSFVSDDLTRGVNFGDNWNRIELTDGAKLTLTDDLSAKNNLDVDIGANSILAVNHADYRGVQSAPTLFSKNSLTRALTKATLTNSGLIDMGTTTADGITDQLIIKGDYHGNNGAIHLNSNLAGDGAASDMLIIDGGKATGTTKLYVDSLLDVTTSTTTKYEGIKVINAINGATTTADSFVIGSGWGRGYQRDDGIMAVAGSDTAYAYLLERGSNRKTGDKDVYGDNEFASDWYLRSGENTAGHSGDNTGVGNNGGGTGGGNGSSGDDTAHKPISPVKPSYGPSVPLYEAYPQVLLNLNRLSTLKQRVGNRFWADGSESHIDATTRLSDQAASLIEQRGFWGRMEGSTGKVTPDHSLTDQNYDLDLWRMQAGMDGALLEKSNGILIGSLSAHFGRAEADVSSDDGHGKVETTGYGIGAAATWYGYNGSYIDLQSQATWFETDNSKNFTRSDTKNEKGFGYALSVEGGHRLEITPTWALTPQIQLIYSSVDFDSFRDGLNTKVSLKDGDSLEGRAGLALSKDKMWQADNGDKRRATVYGIGNLYYEFLDGTKVDVSRTYFRNENEDFQAGLGIGGSYNWNNDKWSLYGETNVRGAFKNVSDNYSFNGTVGLRVKF